jgi:hypothetical protein
VPALFIADSRGNSKFRLTRRNSHFALNVVAEGEICGSAFSSFAEASLSRFVKDPPRTTNPWIFATVWAGKHHRFDVQVAE